MNTDTKRLIHHFRNADVSEGKRGDLDNASPGQSAIRVMVERKQKIMELTLERDNLKADARAADSIVGELVAERNGILTLLGPAYAGEFEVGDKQRPLDSLVSEVLSRLYRADAIIAEREWQNDKWGDRIIPYRNG